MATNLGPFVPERIEEWAYWINERERVRKAKAAGLPPPWSPDPAIAFTRYCNVRRMDDKVSVWLMQNWYSPGRMEPRQALIAGLLARMINRPETLAHMTKDKPYKSWDPDKFLRRMYEVKAAGTPVFTNAYIINGASGGPKIEQVINAIQLCWVKCSTKMAREFVFPDSMQQTAEAMHILPGVGSFIGGQVVADLRWALPEFAWADKMVWAPVGPGSNRGMRYLTGEYNAADLSGRGGEMKQAEFVKLLGKLITIARTHKDTKRIFADRELEAHDIQNTLCELSKYIRVTHGGRGKNKYEPRNQQGELL